MPSLANEFIAQLIVERSRVEIFLLHGICLRGVIDGHDKDAIFLRNSTRAKNTQMILKHAISVIQIEGASTKKQGGKQGYRPAQPQPARDPSESIFETASMEQDDNQEFGGNRNR